MLDNMVSQEAKAAFQGAKGLIFPRPDFLTFLALAAFSPIMPSFWLSFLRDIFAFTCIHYIHFGLFGWGEFNILRGVESCLFTCSAILSYPLPLILFLFSLFG